MNLEYSLEGLMPKFQYFGHLMKMDDSLEKSMILGKTEDARRRGHKRMKWLDGIIDMMNMNLGKFWEMVREMAHCHPRGSKKSDRMGLLNNNSER